MISARTYGQLAEVAASPSIFYVMEMASSLDLRNQPMLASHFFFCSFLISLSLHRTVESEGLALD